MPAYHKNAKESKEKQEQQLPVENLLLPELQEVVKGRFASFCTAAGIQALMTMMEQDVETVAGPKGKHNLGRTAYRHGFQPTTINMGNQRLAITRPRMRYLETNQELPVPSYEVFAWWLKTSETLRTGRTVRW